MITEAELLKVPIDTIPSKHQYNLLVLLDRANAFRTAYGKPLRVTSGYRSLEDHLRIYAAKGITDHAKIPMKSLHLSGQAVDLVPIEDPIEHLHEWVLSNIKLMEAIGFWMEDFGVTKTWTHLQTLPPSSGKRFFLP